jgi:hypothetical protein
MSFFQLILSHISKIDNLSSQCEVGRVSIIKNWQLGFNKIRSDAAFSLKEISIADPHVISHQDIFFLANFFDAKLKELEETPVLRDSEFISDLREARTRLGQANVKMTTEVSVKSCADLIQAHLDVVKYTIRLPARNGKRPQADFAYVATVINQLRSFATEDGSSSCCQSEVDQSEVGDAHTIQATQSVCS